MSTTYNTKEEVFAQSKNILNKTLRDLIPKDDISKIEESVAGYGSSRKGLLGELVEWYVFGKKPDGRSEADFNIAGVELKTNPIKKHSSRIYTAKERLVFSMIDYDKIINETWSTSSFLKKNKILLLMFYVYLKEVNIIDYEFKFIKLLDLLKDISEDDILQIQKDWEFIVAKINRGEAHLLSEADTYYLGACTKAKNSSIVREQPQSRIPAKPRAFSLKPQYLNYLIQRDLLGNNLEAESLLAKVRNKAGKVKTIESVIQDEFSRFIGKTDKQIMEVLKISITKKSKSFKRLLVNKILGITSDRIEELDKANVTLRVITLEHTGKLKESISFPAFDYKDLVTQLWEDEETESMSDFHALLETKKFLFVIFQKIKESDDIVLKKIMFWNFPMKDLPEARKVWDKTIDCINEGRYEDLPKIKDSSVAHVRPHGRNSFDTIETPQKTQQTKRCFWLNAKYIENAIKN